MIHVTAHIDPTAKISEGVSIGPYVVIGANAEIGEGSRIDSHAVIGPNTVMGKRNQVYSFAAVGGDPQDLNYHGEPTFLYIGDDNIIREYVTISRGSTKGDGATKIGHKNMLLAYSHVAHDCILGNEILMTNNATLAGHVKVDDFAILGAFTAVHQFCRVGAYSFLSRATEINKDIPPYMLVKGLPGLPCGLNAVGLKRRGFSEQTIAGLKKAYRIIYRRELRLETMLNELRELIPSTPEVKLIVDLIEESKRGIARQCIEDEHAEVDF